MSVLETRDLTIDFGGFVAINNVEFSLENREKHAIIGPNGAGKTTFFNLITGHLVPTKGSVKFNEDIITGLAPHKIVKRGLARSFQRINIFPKMTVFENIQTSLIARDNKHFNFFSSGSAQNREDTIELL